MKIRVIPSSRVSSLSPGRIALGYAVIAVLWIAFSNAVVVYLKLPPAVQTIKGTVFVFVTATLLYFTIRRLVQFVQQTSEALERLNRELRAISNCNQVLLRSTDEQSLLQEICRLVCEEAGYRVAWVGYAEHDEAKSVRPVALTGAEVETLANLGITWADTERGRGPCGTAIRTGKTICIKDYATEPRGATWTGFALQRGFCSAIGLPLKDEHANAFGSLNIYSAQPSAFTPEEIRLLEELAGDLAFGIVTLRSRAAREQAEQEVALLSFALDKVRETALLIDDTGRFHYVNEEACRVLGYTHAELLDMGVSDIDPEFPVERWTDHWRDLKAQRSLSFEGRHRTRDGRVFPVEISANYFEYGGRAYNLALVRDVTERKRAEEALRRSEAYLAEGQRLTHTGCWAWDPRRDTMLHCSEEIFRIYGLEPQDRVPTFEQLMQRVHPEDCDRVRERTLAGIREKAEHFLDYRIVLPDGTLKYIQSVRCPVLNEAGEVVEVVGTSVDVTEQKRAEQALRESEANLNRAQEIAHIGSWYLDIARNQLTWSNEVYRIFDMPRGTALTYEAFLGRIYPEDREHVDRAWAAALQGATYDIEHRILVGDQLKWVRERAAVEFDPQGKVVRGIGTVQDVTERKRAQEALRLSNAYNRSLIEASLDPLVTIGPDGKIADVNTATEVATGCSRGELIDTDFCDYFTELAQARASYEQVFREGAVRDYPLELRHRSGRVMSVLYNASVYRDESGQVIGVFAAARDITERKRAEEEVRNTAAQWQATFDAVQDLVLLLDKDFRILRANRAAAEFLGLPFDKIVGGHCFNLIHGTSVPPAECPLARMRQSRRHEEEEVLAGKGGPWLSVSVDPVFDQNGELTHVVHVARDITDRKRAEVALRRSEACLAEGQRLSHTGSWAWSPVTFQPLYWSEEMSRIFGLNPQEGMPTVETFWQRIHPEDRDRFRELQMKVAQQSLDYEHDHRIVLPDGTVKHIHAIGHPVRDEAGKLVEYVGTAMDVTELKRAEDALRRSEACLAEGQRLSHTGSWAWNPVTLESLYWSDEMFRIYGLNPQEGIPTAETFWQRIHPEDLDHVRELLMKVAHQSMDYEHDHRILLPDGTVKHIHAIGHPVLGENGQVAEYVGTAVDVTERNQAEENLRKSEQRYRRIVDTASEGIWEVDEQFRTVLVNRRMAEMLGYEPQEMAGRNLGEFLFEDDEADLQSKIADRRQGLTERYEQKYRHKDGRTVWMYVSATSVRDAEHRFIGSFAMLMDITERKLAEDELRKHREHLEDLVKQRTEELAVLNQLVYGSLESGEVGALWIDFKEPDTLHALDNTAGMLGLEPDPTGEKTYKLSNWTNLLANTAVAFPDHAPIIEEARERLLGAISGKYKNYRAVYPLAMPDGSLKWIDARAEIAKRDDYGQALLMTGTIIDITRLKQAEDDLTEAKTRAETANRAKSTFLANMSHELRTPLNAVLGFSRLLKNDPDVTPHQQETLDVVVRSGEHLLNLINNVLDMAKIESGRVALKESEVDLNQLLHEMQSLMGVGAVEKGLRFALEHDPDLPRFVAVDAGKLRQVLLNLLGNAIKYTDSGGVKLRARLASIQGSEKAKVRFEVEDSGPGISQEDCQRIFFPFVQLGDQAPLQAGTGLGLAICKQYVELMGGQIGVTSKPGKGSVFYFEIPVSILPSVAERDELEYRRILGLAEGQPRHRLLIVEDQPENRLLLRRVLEPLGFELREAANGQEAVALFEQWHPDLIWMDIRMPVMDGLEAVRRIRATQAGADTKIIALTAHALEEEREPIMAAGCDDLMRKPFHEQELFGALARHLRLKFIYEKAPRQEKTQEAPALALRPEQLDALPAQLLRDLRQAVIELDTARTQALIEQVTERDASLGRALSTLATQLDYKRLLKLLKRDQKL
ncbi:MAG: PAS domain S-box protein [Limisphaerales bacterium]